MTYVKRTVKSEKLREITEEVIMTDRYEPVNSQDWKQKSKEGEYSLKSLDKDWHGVFLPHLHGV